jgi:hypothetical protein
MRTDPRVSLIYRAVFALLAWFALTGYFNQMVLVRAGGGTFAAGLVSFLSYFTIQTNLLVAVWWTVAVLPGSSMIKEWAARPVIRGALTVYISITFIAYAVLLANTWDPQGWAWVRSIITHYLVPLAFVLDWLLFGPHGRSQWRFVLHWLTYPLAYFIFAMLNGTLTGNFLYPFFDVAALGIGQVAVQTLMLLILFMLLASLLIGLDRRFSISQQV